MVRENYISKFMDARGGGGKNSRIVELCFAAAKLSMEQEERQVA